MIKKYKDFIILLSCLIAIFQLYLYTTFPAFKTDDSPETITSAYNLGISHPPGYPFFTMAGKVLSLLPIGSPAFRINLFAIFLALMVLLLSYFIIKQITLNIFNYENKIINFLGTFILALSYIFWNQAIEAKGGIYILNLLFFAIFIYFSIKLLKGFNIKYLYLISFIYGLSLSNHWPSMIILLPVFGYLFFRYRRKINQKNILTTIMLLLVGLSPYFYLSVRSGTEGIFAFSARANTWENFWWIVLRSGYNGMGPSPSVQLYLNQIVEFLNLFINNYFYFWPLIFAGAYIIYNKSKKFFYFYSITFLIITLIVIFYNRSEGVVEWTTDIFLMPAQYILILFLAAGIYLIFELLKRKVSRYIFLFLLFLIMLFMLNKNIKKNDNRYNYQAYDYGWNIVRTMDKDSLYLCEGDYNFMQLYYIQLIEKQRQDIKLIQVISLPYKWGIEDFEKKYINLDLKEYDPAYNTNSIINYYANNNVAIFKSTYTPNLDSLKLGYNFKQIGLLQEYSKTGNSYSPKIFDLYCYNRELYDKYTDYRATSELVINYLYCMMLQGNEFLIEKNPSAALQLYKKAETFPFRDEMKPAEPSFCYNMSVAYKDLNNVDERIKYLKKTVLLNMNFWEAYQELGEIYFNDRIFPMAKEMFEKAVQFGNGNRELLQQAINAVGNTNITAKYDDMFNQATILMEKGKYNYALSIYEFLINNNYQKTVEIFRNIGVYNYNTGNFGEALKYFQEVKELDKSVGSYVYIAHAYDKLGQQKKALDILNEGIQLLGNDQQLVNLHNQIDQAGSITK